MFGVDLDMDAVEFFNDIGNGKGRQISQTAFPSFLISRSSLGFFPRSFYEVSV